MQITQSDRPALTVIIPVYNGAATLQTCLEGLLASLADDAEVLVIDDYSDDESVHIAEDLGVQVVQNSGKHGPAAARNLGAELARAPILFFIDADVRVREDAIGRILNLFARRPDVDAVFGSYDDTPSEANFLSQFKNLFHHYIHQTSQEDAGTFWAGCGAIRKSVFKQMGGFDESLYRHPSIEDVELGLRLRREGYRIKLDKSLQGTHMKRWTPRSLLRADIFYRAIPWTRLVVSSRTLPTDLNFRGAHRFSAALSGIITAVMTALIVSVVFFSPTAIALLAGTLLISAAVFLILNQPLYSFFARKRGLWFACKSIVWHFFYYLYSGITFVICWILFRIFLQPGSTRRIETESPLERL